MRPAILCRERWERIESVLSRLGGKASIRDLERSYGIRAWEVEQSAELGWLNITVRHPRVGRPSRVAEFRDYDFAKLPEPRCCIEKEISSRHLVFAARSVGECMLRGMPSFGLPGIVSAYVSVYRPRSRRGAYASTSRLFRHPDVRAARHWFHAQTNGELPPGEVMPRTAIGIWARFRELGYWRARLSG